MPSERFGLYRRAMEILIAQEDLRLLRISCAPHMKKQALDSMFTRLEKESRVIKPEPIPMSAENLQRILNG